MPFAITTTVSGFSLGSTAIAGTGQEDVFTFGGTWATGDSYTIILTDNTTAVQTQIGAGFASGVLPTFCLTFDEKVYVLGGATVYTSAIDLPTTFNDPNATGNGDVSMDNWYATAENLVAIAPYQGYLAFFSRRTTQIWNVAPLIENWDKIQTLVNIGTLAPASVNSVGDLDVLFLSDTGIRSLRVRDSSLNAFVNDIGSPIDKLVQAALLSGNGPAACSVVDPESGRYWLYLNGIIYVLSYFPSSKIIAWSTYQPTYQAADGTQVAFTPQKFFIYQGQVWCLATVGGASVLFQYGGDNNSTLDNMQATFQLPFLDAKTPGNWKVSKGVDVVMQGSWTLYGSMDYIGGQFTNLGVEATPTGDLGTIPFSAEGTHFSFRATCIGINGQPLPTLSSVLWHYNLGNETA